MTFAFAYASLAFSLHLLHTDRWRLTSGDELLAVGTIDGDALISVTWIDDYPADSDARKDLLDAAISAMKQQQC